MTKRIGLLTLPLHSNYGGIIQVAALYSVLESAGFQPFLLKKKTYRASWKNIVIGALERVPGQNLGNYRRQHLKFRKHAEFITSFMPSVSEGCSTPTDLGREVDRLGLDAVVVGSDQVWRLDYINDGYYDAYFLSFLNGSRATGVSYAASFGTDVWPDDAKSERVRELLGSFDAVSVREDSGQRLCREKFGRTDAVHVLDPTLLAPRSFHESVIERLGAEGPKGGLFAYVLDQSPAKLQIIESVRVGRGIESALITEPEASLTNYVHLGEWLRRFRDADFVVTDSYHGMIFSIIFEKQFVAIGNNGRGLTRFTSLLKLLNLEDRLFTSEVRDQQFVENMLRTDIDYVRVREHLTELRASSLNFLVNAVSGDLKS